MSTNNNASSKRKRCDDRDDGCDKERLCHDDNNNNNIHEESEDVKPDVPHSSTISNNYADLDLPPSGEFPTNDQLFKILTFIENACDDGDKNRLDSALKAISYLRGCSRWGDNAHADEKKKFRDVFCAMGGPLRLYFLIKEHMGKSILVEAVAGAIISSTNDYPSYRAMVHDDGLRYLHLTTEELIPSNDESNWKAATAVWRLISILVEMPRAYNDSNHIIRFLEADSDFLKASPNNFVSQKVEIAGCLARIANLALNFRGNNKDMVDIIQHNKTYQDILVFCMDNASIWVEKWARVHDVVLFCKTSVYKKLIPIPSTELLTTVIPVVLKALESHYMDIDIEEESHEFLKHAVDTIDHRELEKTAMVPTLYTIIKSTDAPERKKSKYRQLLARLMS